MQREIGLLILRVGLGGLMLTHGWGKLQKLVAGDVSFANPIGIGEVPSLILAVVAEFLCAVLVILGVKTRWTAIPLVITMAVAAFVVHAGDPFGRKELALLYLVGFLGLVFTGGGTLSVDGVLAKGGGKRR
jgi:putative oxidoreductase